MYICLKLREIYRFTHNNVLNILLYYLYIIYIILLSINKAF